MKTALLSDENCEEIAQKVTEDEPRERNSILFSLKLLLMNSVRTECGCFIRYDVGAMKWHYVRIDLVNDVSVLQLMDNSLFWL